MQVVNKNDIEKRLLFYWSKIYSKSIKSGDEYKDLQRTIAILFTDYKLEKLREVKEYITKWNIREEKYSHLILTNDLEIYIIELGKADKCTLEGRPILNSWLEFINNSGVVLGMENKEINQARKVLEEISQDERERRLTELREKYIRDQHAVEEYGYDKGYSDGIIQGVKQTKIEIVRKLKSQNIDIKSIAEITELSEMEINNVE